MTAWGFEKRLVSGLLVFPLILKCLYASGGSLSTNFASSSHRSRTMNVWSGVVLLFCWVLRNLALALYLSFKKNFVFSKLLQQWEVAQSCSRLGHLDTQAPGPSQQSVVCCGNGLSMLLCMLSVQNWQWRRCNAACFPLCLLCMCGLELLPVRAWSSS